METLQIITYLRIFYYYFLSLLLSKDLRDELKTDFAFFTQFTPNKTAKKEVAHNKRKIKVSLAVYYVETFEC